jgi:SAM-dependent methyltransferase
MEPGEYLLMRSVEDRHWWYRSLRSLITPWLADAPALLDAGCGTGGTLLGLGRGTGVDISTLALSLCRERGLGRVAAADVQHLPFAEGAFDAVLVLDVLYHRRVTDDRRVLAECARVVKPGGVVLIHVPAFRFLAGEHDRAVHGVRRYTASQLRDLVRRAGLGISLLTYRHLALLPAALLLRRGEGGRPREMEPRSDLGRPNPLVNTLLLALCELENRLVRWCPLPAGLSLFCAARRPG